MSPLEVFEGERRRLMGLAYRMLGSVAEAEDVVQDAYLRWHGAAKGGIGDVRAYLSTIVTRLCLDRLKSARARRETYMGPWLPEPVVDGDAFSAGAGEGVAHDVSVAFLLALERLSPPERAAFLLHDVFDMGYPAIAAALGKTEAACRQLAARARRHVQDARPRFRVEEEEGARLMQSFLQAAAGGDVAGLARLLAEDALLLTDGGGKAMAALNPVLGADRIARFFVGLARKSDARLARMRFLVINGLPGLLMANADGSLQTMALDVVGGIIRAVYMVRNPDKLRHLRWQTPSPFEAGS